MRTSYAGNAAFGGSAFATALVSATHANKVGEHSHFDIAAKAAFLFQHSLSALQMLRICLFAVWPQATHLINFLAERAEPLAA
jgi:hypothetical protein